MKKALSRKSDDQDFSKFLGEETRSKKQRLLEECEKCDVSIYIEDSTERAAGDYGSFRAVASEAELEQRLNAKKVIGLSIRANFIAAIALLVSLVALLKSFL